MVLGQVEYTAFKAGDRWIAPQNVKTDDNGVDRYSTDILVNAYSGDFKLLDKPDDVKSPMLNTDKPEVKLDDEIPF